MEILQKRKNLFAGARVQIAGGFVGQEDGGASGQGASQGDALLLTAGEFAGAMVSAVFEADLGEQLEGAGAGEVLRFASNIQGIAAFSAAVNSGSR